MKQLFIAAIALTCITAPVPALAEPTLPADDGHQNYVETRHDGEIDPGDILKGVLYYGAGAAATIFFFQAGGKMSDIRSVSGNSTAEAFYQGMGTVSYGLEGYYEERANPGVLDPDGPIPF